MTPRFLPLALLAFVLVALPACDTTEPPPPNEEELITQVRITLTNQADASDVVTITALDADGDGRDFAFTPATLTLTSGATYSGTIELDDTLNGVDITDEIRDEAEEHLFRYAVTPVGAGTVALTDTESDYTDEDDNGADYAVGLTFSLDLSGTALGDGDFGVILYHFDDAPKTGNRATSDEIDVDLEFPVTFVQP